MGNPAGVRRDFQALEQRRLRAAQLLKKGVHPSEVARQVGAHRQSVSRWAQLGRRRDSLNHSAYDFGEPRLIRPAIHHEFCEGFLSIQRDKASLGSAPRGVQTQCFKAPVEFIPVSLGCNHNAGIARPSAEPINRLKPSNEKLPSA